MEFDRLKCTLVLKSKSDTSNTSDDDDEAYTISDGHLLSYIVGEVSEVRLDRKSRTSSFKKSA
jgi:hypothetical protein